MKKRSTITGLRNISNVLIALVFALFIGFSAYLWVAYHNVLRDGVVVSADKQLLTNFDTSKFDRAVERLKKRQAFENPAEGIHDPFGVIPE